jgi:hypothetical protein
VADSLSRKFVNLALEKGDVHVWTELGGQGRTSARYLGCQGKNPGVAAALRARFAEKKVFVEEIDAVLELDHSRSAGEEGEA